MKYSLVLLFFVGFLSACKFGQMPQKNNLGGIPPMKTRDTLVASIKHYGKNKLDTLVVLNKTITLKVAVPYSDKIHFLVQGVSKSGVFLQSKDRVNELVFRARDTSWSILKTRKFYDNRLH